MPITFGCSLLNIKLFHWQLGLDQTVFCNFPPTPIICTNGAGRPKLNNLQQAVRDVAMFAPFWFKSDDIFFPAPSDSAHVLRGSLGGLGLLVSEISTRAAASPGEERSSRCPAGVGSISQRQGEKPILSP